MNISVDIRSVDVDGSAAEPSIIITLQLGASQATTFRFLLVSVDLTATVGDRQVNLGSRPLDYVGPGQNVYFRVPFELGNYKINALEKLRTKDVTFMVTIKGVCQTSPSLAFDQIDYNQAQRKVASSDWIDWMKLWGKDLKEITISGQTLTKIEEIKEIQGKDPSETISNLGTEYLRLRRTIDQLKKESAIECVFTELETRTIKEKMSSMLTRLTKEDTLLITGYLGSAFLDKILAIVGNGSKIRVITRSLTGVDKETRESTLRIFKASPEGVRQNDTIHARIFAIEGKEALVSSADIKSDSIDTNYEAGLWTDNPIVISELSKFFDRAWKESKPFKT